MRVIIFGGAGFIGKKLALELLDRGEIAIDGSEPKPISELVLFDKLKADGLPNDDRLVVMNEDICDSAIIEKLLAKRVHVIFHLAAIVSGEAEKNFDLGMQVNLHANLTLLEKCRVLDYAPTMVFASSCGVFGGELTDVIGDQTGPTPKSSYGTQKAVVDLLINDYTRRGFIKGRAIRLPTIAIRPGKPNAATSSFISSIIREPLQGKSANCPVSAESKFWILSPKKVVENFIIACELPNDAWKGNWVVNLPGLTTPIADMVKHLELVGGKEAAELITWEPDEFLQSIVLTWPPEFVTTRAIDLGFKKDENVGEIIQAFINEELT
ncbi:MAG: nucleoside-diphosphate-sugar epimerase [Cyclobacteriaceae bacterium]|jgi:nucleoside-diphosphate-sugar epimerase